MGKQDDSQTALEGLLLAGLDEVVPGLAVRLLVEGVEPRRLSEVERERLLEALRARAAQGERQQHLATVGRLAAGVAHEVRNILTPLRGAVQIAMARGDSVGPALLADVEAQTARAATQLAGLIHVGMPGSEDARPIDLASVVGEVSTLLQHEASRAQTALQVTCGGGACFVEDRGGRVRQILVNLVLNAIGTEQPGRIELSLTREGAELWVTVTDQGPGVDAALRERIFEPFFSTRLEQGGSGLGLALSRDMARELGGDLRLVDTETGASFRLSLPEVSPK